MTRELAYTVLFPFCGLGGGALGFLRAEAEFRQLGLAGRFRVLGGIDNDPLSCVDFRRLTGADALCADIAELTPEELRGFAGQDAPDVVFLSPPCKGASGLLSAEKSRSPKYAAMNQLALIWTRTMLAAWSVPPRLVLLENVPRLKTRAPAMLREVRSLLKASGYVFSDGYHDCGEIGGLAQHRQRYLLVARHAKRVPALLYQPSAKRVRACGEVLGELPLPGAPEAGPLHVLPRISLLNWIRLALIPPGGDWRDLPAAVAAQSGNAGMHENKYRVVAWREPAQTVIAETRLGSGGPSVADPRRQPFNNVLSLVGWGDPVGAVNGGAGPTSGCASVADPRMAWYRGTLGIASWSEAMGVVTGRGTCSTGRFSVADPRLGAACYAQGYGVMGWDDAAHTVTGRAQPTTGIFAVADPRVGGAFHSAYGVLPWGAPAHTVTSTEGPSTGTSSVADPRVASPGCGYTNQLAMLAWGVAARSITGASHVAGGLLSVCDPRLTCTPHPHTYGLLGWDHPSHTVTGMSEVGTGPFSVADHRVRPGAYANTHWHVGRWDCASITIICQTDIQAGAPSVADPRLGFRPRDRSGAYGVTGWGEPSVTITGQATHDNGRFAVADPRVPGSPRLAVAWYPTDVRSAPPWPLVLPTADGTWHRPLTTLELAALQGLPTSVDGRPLTLSGSSVSGWRERIGNAVPPPAAEAIARQMLLTLVQADVGAFSLSGDREVWVEPPRVSMQVESVQ